MFEDFLTKTYYGNTVREWLFSLLIILGVAIIGKLLYWVITKFIKAFTTRTKNKLDDIIIDMIEEPIIFAMILAGIWYALSLLHFSQGMLNFINHAFEFLIVINITWLLSRLFEALYEEYMVPFAHKSENDIDDQLFPILRQGLKGILWTLGIIIGLNNAGYDVAAILAGLGLGGLALAMAAKDTVSNVFGGITIFTDKMFKVKERIKVDGIEGNVEEIGLRSTKIRTLDGRLVTVPNSTFTNNPVENVTSEPSRKVLMTIGVSYDTSPAKLDKAVDILKKILAKNKSLLDTQIVFFNGFNESSLDILVIYYIKPEEDIGGTKSSINMEILKQFNKNRIDMPFPTRTILTKKA